MPEIAEVARIVHHLKRTLVGKTLSKVKAQDDTIVFGKVGTSAAEFEKALTGKKVMDAGQQGKYFWLIMSSPPHPVFHFGMTGWFYIRGDPNVHYRPKNSDEVEVWPPKYWKFALETDGLPIAEAAFTDARRLARIRLLDCVGGDIRTTTPLKENGPDPVIDKHILTKEWLEKKMLSKKIPVKALLLDQANISGIGNWVGDEILYHAKLHPEQYSNTFTAAQLKQLHTSIMYVCDTAVGLLADSSRFPEEWLFNHRWGKGKKDAPKSLPNGAKITFLTVGGRTSCVVPSVQKKTGAVAGDVKFEDKENATEAQVEDAVEPVSKATLKKRKTVLTEDTGLEQESTSIKANAKPVPKKAKKQVAAPTKPDLNLEARFKSKKKDEAEQELEAPVDSRRRSGRVVQGKV